LYRTDREYWHVVKVSRAKPIGQNSSSLLEGRLTGDDHTLLDRRLSSYNVTNSHNNRSSVNQMLEHLEWKSLEQRRKDARLTMMYKITNEKVAIPKEGRLIPPKRLSRNMHDKGFQIPSAASDYRKYCSSHVRSGTGTPPLLG
jgi:hypothetical protein